MGQDTSPDAAQAIVAEARAQVAAGRAPDVAALAKRLHGVATDEAARRQALAQLERVAAVHRARSLVERPVAPPPPAPPAPRRSLGATLRTKPTIVGNLDVRRDDGFALAWDHVPAVVAWEVRFSERADARSDYRELEALELPAQTTRVELPLGDRLFRVNVIGRSRDGRPVRRALLSALTRESWAERWQRRATSS